MDTIKGVSVKVKFLRRRGYDNLEEWMNVPEHELVCRNGRIFIGKGESKKVFHYRKSEWHNPFKMKEYTLEQSLENYEHYLMDLLNKDPECMERFIELREKKEIGCFCDEGNACHRDIIIRILELVNV